MICKNIQIADLRQNLFIKNQEIKDFGVSFNIEYDESLIRDCKGILEIKYEIKLAKDRNKLFGVIACRYDFSLELTAEDYFDNEIKDEVIRKCLKLNHSNIFNLVNNTLEKNHIN